MRFWRKEAASLKWTREKKKRKKERDPQRKLIAIFLWQVCFWHLVRHFLVSIRGAQCLFPVFAPWDSQHFALKLNSLSLLNFSLLCFCIFPFGFELYSLLHTTPNSDLGWDRRCIPCTCFYSFLIRSFDVRGSRGRCECWTFTSICGQLCGPTD